MIQEYQLMELHVPLITSRMIYSLRTDGTSVTEGGDTAIANKIKIHTDMTETIHWKALEEHFLMVHVPLFFRFNEMYFMIFSQKT
jgi:hypothetical protein